MASSVDIVNLALSHIGDEAAVTSISPADGTEQAAQAAKFYPIALETILEAHDWNFAMKRKNLAELSTTPPDAWEYAYAVPGDMLTPISVLPQDAPDETIDLGYEVDYVIEALTDGTRVIYCNIEQAAIRYVARITDTSKFSMMFINALTRLLASFLAGPILKGDAGAKANATQWELYEKVWLPKAKEHDGRTKKNDVTHVPGSIAARSGVISPYTHPAKITR